MEYKNRLVAIAIKYEGDWQKIYDSIDKRENIEDEYIQKAEALKCKTVTLLDEDYPFSLRQAPKPPFVLFYYGDLSIISHYRMNVSMVCSRHPSPYGLKRLVRLLLVLPKKDMSSSLVTR